MYTSVLFNSVDLTTLSNNIQINAIDIYKRPVRNLQLQKLARRDGQKLVNAEYAEKIITIEGIISGTSRANFESLRDTFLRYLDAKDATLRFSQSGANRDYTATVSNIVWNNTGGGLATFSIEFNCSDPLGYDTSNTTDVNGVTITTASSVRTITAVGGSYAGLPTITVLLNSGTGLTSKAITITDQTGAAITITRTWVAADSLVVDSAAKTVKVNGSAVDYTGTFPCLKPGDTQITYADGLTTRNVTFTVVHKNRYL